MKILDLYCCEGGSAKGYANAGFDVVGVDIAPQPRYPFEFHQADALEFFVKNWNKFNAWHASPPCQAHTRARNLQGNIHVDLIPATRERFAAANARQRLMGVAETPWIIENVPGSPLLSPTLLCGSMFGLETYRHRLFETNWTVAAPLHPEHVARTTKMGRPPQEGEFMHVVGNFSGVDRGRAVMGMPWATQYGLAQAIPPAYTEFLGRQLMRELVLEVAE